MRSFLADNIPSWLFLIGRISSGCRALIGCLEVEVENPRLVHVNPKIASSFHVSGVSRSKIFADKHLIRKGYMIQPYRELSFYLKWTYLLFYDKNRMCLLALLCKPYNDYKAYSDWSIP